ncbi:hypothetical protein ABIA39_004795 [Nocardia sp. GAS34]|jgi:hypothetical protein|uniref:hypothetical protein n=1 Tax=unclassified Nocardia TaxID=2637762 RepID=UPI003D25070D
MLAFVLLAVLAAAVTALAAALFLAPSRAAQDIPETLPDKAIRTDGGHNSHRAPDTALPIPDAHRAMRDHRSCRMRDCPRKRAAYTALRDAGKLVPDLRVARWMQ